MITFILRFIIAIVIIEMNPNRAFSDEILLISENSKGSLLWTAIPLTMTKENEEITGRMSGSALFSILLNAFIPVKSIVIDNSLVFEDKANFEFEVKRKPNAPSFTIFSLLNKNTQPKAWKLGLTMLKPLSAIGCQECSVNYQKAVLQVRDIETTLSALKHLTKKALLVRKSVLAESEINRVIKKIDSSRDKKNTEKLIIKTWEELILKVLPKDSIKCQIIAGSLIVNCSKDDVSFTVTYIDQILE